MQKRQMEKTTEKMRKYVSLIAMSNGNYLVQAREVSKPEFKPGEYPFLFPGACSLFGGALEGKECYTEGLRRALREEIPSLKLPLILAIRQYRWAGENRRINEILEKANHVFHENVLGFLGFDLNSLVPRCALGRDRGKKRTYRDLICMSEEDTFCIAELPAQRKKEIKVQEGIVGLWIPHEAARSLVMVPSDKLALLDDYCDRVLKGELKI